VAIVEFTTAVHQATARNYLQRVVEHDKAECAEVASKFGEDYWDGDRKYGYGGFRYDGRWKAVAERMASHYDLKPGARILDVGCGKGFLLYDLSTVVPDSEVVGIDISPYAVANAKEEVRPYLQVGNASALPFEDNSFDLVISINTLHNLYNYDLWPSLREIERVGRGAKYVVVEAYRNEREKVNLMYWQLTCRAFHTPAEWEWLYQQAGYTGDYSFIYFE
jgi:ubiquinone/menaquinone biosynthesis C-methylase UbiE